MKQMNTNPQTMIKILEGFKHYKLPLLIYMNELSYDFLYRMYKDINIDYNNVLGFPVLINNLMELGEVQITTEPMKYFTFKKKQYV